MEYEPIKKKRFFVQSPTGVYGGYDTHAEALQRAKLLYEGEDIKSSIIETQLNYNLSNELAMEIVNAWVEKLRPTRSEGE